MGAMWKKEVLIRPSSVIAPDDAITWTEGWLESFYVGENAPDLPDDLAIIAGALGGQGNRNYTDELRGSTDLDDFFADVFDSRDKVLYRVFHSACALSRGMSQLVFRLTPDLSASGETNNAGSGTGENDSAANSTDESDGFGGNENIETNSTDQVVNDSDQGCKCAAEIGLLSDSVIRIASAVEAIQLQGDTVYIQQQAVEAEQLNVLDALIAQNNGHLIETDQATANSEVSAETLALQAQLDALLGKVSTDAESEDIDVAEELSDVL